MNTYLGIAALATLSALAIPALADEPGIPTQRVEITAPYAAARTVLASVDKDLNFQLENGRRAAITVTGDTLQLFYRNRRSLLKHDGLGGFKSGDGRVSLMFTLDSAGEPSQVAVSAPADWF